MRGTIVAALACAVISSVGCAGNAKFVIDGQNKGPNPVQGVIELKAGADPKEVARLIEKELGSGYAFEPMPGTQGSVVQGSAFNPNAAMPGNAPAANGSPTYYQYTKKMQSGTTPNSLPPVDTGMTQTGFQQRSNMGLAPTAGMGNMAPNAGMAPAVIPGTR